MPRTRKPMRKNTIEVQVRQDVATTLGVSVAMVATLALAAALLIGIFSILEQPQTSNPTQALLAKQVEYQKTSLSNQGSVEQEMVLLAQKRLDYLKKLAVSDSTSFTNNLLTQEQITNFPASVRNYLEETKALKGSLNAYIYDAIDQKGSVSVIRYQDAAELDNNRTAPVVHFLGSTPSVVSRTSIAGEAILLDGEYYVPAGKATLNNTNSTDTVGLQKTAVFMIQFSNTSQDRTAAYYQDMYFGTTSGVTTVNNYYLENSFNQTSFPLTGSAVKGWYQISQPKSNCANLESYVFADSRVQADLTAGSYDRVAFVTSDINYCEIQGGLYGGYSTIGKVDHGSLGTFSSSYVYHGPDAYTNIHEMGHQLGVYHGNNIDCYPNQTKPNLDNCTEYPYEDIYSTMGLAASGVPHFSAVSKNKLGWLLSGEVATVNSDGTQTFTLSTLESAATSLKVVRILREQYSGGKLGYLYVERRSATGFDASIDGGVTGHVTNGVLIHYAPCDAAYCNSTSGDAHLLIANPNLQVIPPFDPALHPGQTFVDKPQQVLAGRELEIRITVMSITSSTVTIKIYYGNYTCTDGTPQNQCNSQHQYCTPTSRNLVYDCRQPQCGYTCTAPLQCDAGTGQCATLPACYSDNDCADSISCNVDKCNYAGTTSASCSHTGGTCCANGTLPGQCSSMGGSYCTSERILDNNRCPICGCKQFYKCNPGSPKGTGACVPDPTTCCLEETSTCKLPLCPWRPLNSSD